MATLSTQQGSTLDQKSPGQVSVTFGGEENDPHIDLLTERSAGGTSPLLGGAESSELGVPLLEVRVTKFCRSKCTPRKLFELIVTQLD